MRRMYCSYEKSQIVVAAALALAIAAPASALTVPTGSVGSSETSMELVMTPRKSGRADVMRTMTRDMMAYRLKVGSAPSGTWAVTVVISGAAGSNSIHLSNEAPEITLPRPLGLLLRASDTVRAVASYDSDGVEDDMTLHIEYEPSDRAGARLAVMPVHAEVHSATGDTASSWRFTAEVSGRVLALAGLPMKRVHAMALIDEASGRALWSTTVNHKTSHAYCPELPRLGAMVEAGRTYRVDVVFTEYISITHLTGAVAMVLPQLMAKQ